jgi:hypothetical protein
MPNYKYLIIFRATGNVVFLQQSSFLEAFEFVEKTYGTSWRNLCEIHAHVKIEA